MRRALQLARLGEGLVSPNPMVGAVIVSAKGRIIGEGYHHRYGDRMQKYARSVLSVTQTVIFCLMPPSMSHSNPALTMGRLLLAQN